MKKGMTPTQAVKCFCKSCCGGTLAKVKNCGGEKLLIYGEKGYKCPLFDHRLGKGRVTVKTIRKHCLTCCMGESKSAVKECTSENCPLYPFRLGTNPNYGKENRNEKSKTAKKFNLSALGLLARKK